VASRTALASGASVVVPAGWRLVDGPVALVEDPAGVAVVRIVERPEADLAAAAAAAWHAAIGRPAPVVATVAEVEPVDGWDLAATVAFAPTGAAGAVAGRAELRRRGRSSRCRRPRALPARRRSSPWPRPDGDEVLPLRPPRGGRARFIDDARARLAVPGAAVGGIGVVAYAHTSACAASASRAVTVGTASCWRR
jgi:hypothetical protein